MQLRWHLPGGTRSFQVLSTFPDSYGISVLKNAVLNHCGIKTKRVCILGEVGRDVNTASMREQHLKKVAAEVKKLS